MWSPSSSSAEDSFGVAGGEFTEAEKKYLIRKGLAWEDSKGEMFDISTDVDDANSSRASNTSSLNMSVNNDSLLLFEENERQLRNASFAKHMGSSPGAKPMTLRQMNLNASDFSVSSSQMDFDEEDEDKENMCHDQSLSYSSILEDPPKEGSADDSFAAVLSERKLDLDDYAKMVCEADSFRSELEKSMRTTDEPNEDSVLVPCTQDVMNDTSTTDPECEDYQDIIPSTQYVSQIENSGISDDDNDSRVIVPCTQYPDDSYQSDKDISSVPCSQSSTGEGSSKEDLDDTITMMTKLLAMADEQEAKEKMAAEATADDGSVLESSVSNVDDRNCSHNMETQTDDGELGGSSNDIPANSDDIFFKTPLKCPRVQMLKNKKICTPSPPRSYVNSLLQRGADNKTAVIKKVDPVKLSKPSTPIKPKPFISTSTPNRTPFTNITPVRKTPGLFNGKTPISSKIDTGLKRSPGFLAIGLSPVADYIHSKPPPSKFVRTQGISKQTPQLNSATSKTSLPRPNNSFTRIPAPPRFSQAQTDSKIATKEQKRHSILKTETFFDSTSTPPKIVNNIPRFAKLEYKGPAKVKTTDGKVESSPKKDFVAHRHTGIRDVSGNASFIQNATIQKRFIPAQSRLATPPSYTRK
ncbi:hypothetical protein Ocin01_00420 [Orchesella cincta]|uniref:Uncharacterized protein n=1 Tax=Orchesella cincta TaxID=48709 RepID=A0A1D2NM10_ORCCI|nr:hypothetical protein Ocin01_00420 [Orchesella cincta]